MSYDFKAQRLFVEAPLSKGASVQATAQQAHYLLHVLRLGAGDAILLFNGVDGEWRAEVLPSSRRACALRVLEPTRPQPIRPDLHYLFAPLKSARLDYMVQKAVEMGVGRLRPVLTRHTQVARLNGERMRANAVEAAEQCGILSLIEIDAPARLPDVLDVWEADRRLVFCDESAGAAEADPLGVLARLGPGPLAVLVGPEGGFSAEERAQIRARPFAVPLSLGPRILRADTAAVAALALVQAAVGDWRLSASRT